jgi:hypothetical protein
MLTVSSSTSTSKRRARHRTVLPCVAGAHPADARYSLGVELLVFQRLSFLPQDHVLAHCVGLCYTLRVETTASRSIWVSHSGERVRAALVNSGLVHPRARLTVNLAPADLRKEGPAYDLPIAVGILLASGQVSEDLSSAGLVGERPSMGT